MVINRAIRFPKIIRLAEQAFKKFGEKSIPVDVEKIASYLNINLVKSHCEGDISGYLHIDSEGTPLIALNTNHSPERQRFTLAHELGHYLLHSPTSNSSFVDKTFFIIHRDSTSSEGIDPREIEANLFAAELLMPATNLYQDIARSTNSSSTEKLVSELSEIYKVSGEAMRFRLANLGFIRLGSSEK